MRKKFAIALTAGGAAATVGFGATGTAGAAPNEKGACVQAGIGTLKSLGILQAAAQKQVNYALIDSNGPGIPSEVAFAPGGGLDRSLHLAPVRIPLAFDDGTLRTVTVNLYGTVE